MARRAATVVEESAVNGATGSARPAAHRASRSKLRSLGEIAKRFGEGGWRPATEVLLEVEAVPTRFPQIDAMTKVGGWPTSRVALVHGPSNEGKTELCIGLGASFVDRGHFFALVDAEHTTPITWARQLMGPAADTPYFFAKRPRTYEETVDAVRAFCEAIAEARERREIDRDTTALVVVDSLRKLHPKRLLEKLSKEGADAGDTTRGGVKVKAGGVDGMAGRAAQYKAALNAAWMDELVPMLGQTRCGLVLIGRETDDPDSFTGGFKVSGGKAPYYDSSVVARVQRARYVTETRKVNGKDEARTLGERHRVELYKTKIGGKEERLPDAHYHSSNGAAAPVGFDRPRDLLELAEDRKVVAVDGGHGRSFRGERFGQGENAAVRALWERPDLMAAIDEETRAAVYGEDAR